jgi:hypothetical protein
MGARRCRTPVLRTALVALAAALAVTASAGACQAQEIQLTGPLSNSKPKAIPFGKRPYRVRRFHLAAEVATTLGDPLLRTGLPGLRASYHPSEWWGVSLWGAYAFHGTTAAADRLQTEIDARACDRAPTSPICAATASSVTRAGTNADGTPRTGRLAGDQLGSIAWVAAPAITVVPFHGKIVLLDPSLLIGLGVDVTLTLGAALVGARERAPCTAGHCAGQFSLENRLAVAPLLGAGLAFHPILAMSFGLELRALPFSSNPTGFDVRGHGSEKPDGAVDAADRSLRANGLAAAFVAVHFPLTRSLP